MLWGGDSVSNRICGAGNSVGANDCLGDWDDGGDGGGDKVSDGGGVNDCLGCDGKMVVKLVMTLMMLMVMPILMVVINDGVTYNNIDVIMTLMS